jgi:hypothetical protein
LRTGKNFSLQFLAFIEQLAKQMKFFNLRTAFATVFIVILTACGGENMNSAAALPDQLAATAGSGGTPLPDCAPEACKLPRIIDGLAEQFRATAMAQLQQDGAAGAAANGMPADGTPSAGAPAAAAPAPTVITL